MKLHVAQAIAAKLLKRLAPGEFDGAIVGSVRRGKNEPKDIELTLPWAPSDCEPVYRRLLDLVGPPEGALFGEAPTSGGPRGFDVVKGFKPGFRYCQLRSIPGDAWARCDAALRVDPFCVDLFRFDPGPHGNRGWIELMRTGPAEFGEACLSLFKRHGGGGSRDGYLINGNGRPIPTPTELDAFQALQVAWLEPHERCAANVRHQVEWHEPILEDAIPFG